MQGNPGAEQVLDQMHNAILIADFPELGRLAPKLEAALQDAGQIKTPAALQSIQRKAERNAACLLAAGRGVRSALRRLAEVQGAGTALITYDGSGKRADHGATGQLTRRF